MTSRALSSLIYWLQLLATLVLVVGLFAVPVVFMAMPNRATALVLEDDVMGDRWATVYLPEGTSWMSGGGGGPKAPADLPADAEVPDLVEEAPKADARRVYRPDATAPAESVSTTESGAGQPRSGKTGRGGTGSGGGEGSGTGSGTGDGVGPGSSGGRPGGGGSLKHCPPEHPAIQQTGPNEYRISRTLVDTYTVNTSAIMRLGWVREHEDAAGRLDGFEIGGFGCAGVLYYAGLRRNDVVYGVNGKPVQNLVQALAAYRKFRRLERVTLTVGRGSTRMMITYHLY